MNNEERRKLEKAIFISSIFLGGLCLMIWSRNLLQGLINFQVPLIQIDAATIIGIALIYGGIRFIKHRI